MQIKRYASLLVGASFLGLAVVLWAIPSQPDDPGTARPLTRVLVEPVQSIQTQRAAVYSGVTRAKHRAVLSFSVPARVSERRVDVGALVDKGDVLARLDDREFRNAVRRSQARVAELTTRHAQATRDRRRFEKLAASDVVTVSDLEKATTRETALAASLNAATAQLKEARRMLGETVLTAPFSGTVTELYLQPGEWAVPGRPAVALTGDGEVELLVEVPESMIAHLTAGQAVEVVLPFADDRRVPGRIGSLARAASSAGRLFPVKVDLAAEPGVTAGMTARLMVDVDTAGVLTVPLGAVVNPGASQPHLFIYHQGRVTRRPVTVGGIIGDRIVVRGEIAEGDQVVTAGQSRLADGEQVEVTS